MDWIKQAVRMVREAIMGATSMGARPVGDLHVVALCKGIERYVWLFDDCHREEAIASARRMAADPSLSLTWFDAGNAVRQMVGSSGERMKDEG